MLSAALHEGDGADPARLPAAAALRAPGDSRPRRGATSPQGVTLGGYRAQPAHPRISPGSARSTCVKANGVITRWCPRRGWPPNRTPDVQRQQSRKPDWDQGYGYQFWRCRHGRYRGDGAFGQYCIVMPEQDAVLAITSGVRNMQEVLDLVWGKLLPGMKPAPLPADGVAQRDLARRVAGSAVRPAAGKPASPVAAAVSGRRFSFPANDRGIESVVFEFGDAKATVAVRTARGQPHPVRFRRLGQRPERLCERAGGASPGQGRTPGGGQRRVDGGRHLHREALPAGDAVLHQPRFPVRRGSRAVRLRVPRRLRPDDPAATDRDRPVTGFGVRRLDAALVAAPRRRTSEFIPRRKTSGRQAYCGSPGRSPRPSLAAPSPALPG